MSRVPHRASLAGLPRRSNIGIAFTGAMLVVLLAAGLVQAAPVTVGFRDFAYDPGQASRATADAQQSKLWFANNVWYGGFYSSADNSFNIWQLNETTHVWADSHIKVDLRDKVHGDYLFDTAANKLYVVSTKSPCTSTTNSCNDAVTVSRFTFHLANPLATRFTLDFTHAIFGGLYNGVPPSAGGAETVTIAKDASNLFVAWTRRSAANAQPSVTQVASATLAAPTVWTAPFTINAGEDGQSNISALVSFGAKVGIYYTDAHLAGGTPDTGLFQIHTAGDPITTWAGPETAAASSANDEANVKADVAGNVYVAYKTRASVGTSAQISLLKRDTAGTWTNRGVSDVDSANVRPQVAIDTEFNGGAGALFVIMSESEFASADGNVYYKVAPLTGAGALTYTTTGKGTTLIDSATDNDIEDATTTKQVLNEVSGLVVEATDKASKFYLHNLIPLPAAVDVTGPVGTVAINGNPTPDSTSTSAVTLTIAATDPSGVASMRIINSPDGTSCPVTGSPALLTGGTTEPFAVTKPWTLSAGEGVHRVCIQFLDSHIGGGNWSAPVFDDILIDTTGPVGAVNINGGAATTPLADVSVDVTATDPSNPTVVRLSNTATMTGPLLTDGVDRPYGTPQPWTLTPGDGLKTVYVQWKDSLGNWSAVSSDTITLTSVDTTFTAITPVRLLDSRHANPAGITIFRHGVPQTFQITGRGGIPANAVAITGNLSVVGQTRGGYVTLGPSTGAAPSTSTINFPINDVRANGVFVSLNSSGQLQAVYVSSAGKKVHVFMDVTGYFVPGQSTNEYFPVKPARFLDTRKGVPGGAHLLRPNVPFGFQVGGRTVGTTVIPADAVAITGNLTVTGQTKAGYLSLTPTSVASPSTSTLNFPVGDTRANNVTAKLGPTGKLYVVYKGTGRAHALLDVTGYFRNDDVNGLVFVPLTPTRTVNTRNDLGITNPLPHGAPRSWTVRNVGGVGPDAQAFTGNVTISHQTRAGFVSVTPTPTTSPGTSTINFPLGDTRANGLAAPINSADGKASVIFRASAGTTEFIVDVTGYFH